ncbi:MAG: tRNA pseudouridine(55) synthase TruB [Bacteroidia bacterium]|nr:MAG: tRNA pseudouridine(55) synthase TruB [Bacteroidia bacterium]PIE86536.1 MAG: tRNA pseudouridine(55) synthase TruB [Bacteroidia bacterium]
MDFTAGEVIVINKALKWTSFDVVNRIRALIKRHATGKRIKVGHAGTLDPLASGLMIVCTGKKTKKIESFMGMAKEYYAGIKLGATTPSFDLETEINAQYDYRHITEKQVKDCLVGFVGKQSQIPPVYSAKKIKGKPAYDYARKGETVEIKAKEIEIYEIELVHFDLPLIEIRILCSKGTYIRSLARDIGQKLKSGAYLAALKRTLIGEYKLEESISIEKFEELIKS